MLGQPVESAMPTVRCPRPDEREAVWDLVGEVFGQARLARRTVRDALADEPFYRDEQTLVAVGPRAICGHLAFYRCELSLGEVSLPVGRIGSVAVAAPARRRGVGTRLVQAAHEVLGDVAAICLDPAHDAYVRQFYEQLGYVAARRCIGYQTVDASLLPPPTVVVRPATAADVAALDRLYRATYGRRAGTFSRGDEWWRRRCERQPLLWVKDGLEVQVADDGAVVGYAMSWYDGLHQVLDLACEPGRDDAAAALLRHRAGGAPQLGIHVADDEAAWPWLSRLAPVDESPPPCTMMLRVVSSVRLVGPLRALLASRGAELQCDDEAVLSVEGGGLRCGWSRFLALCLDGAPLGEWAAGGQVAVEGELAAVQAVLPPRRATRRPADGF